MGKWEPRMSMGHTDVIAVPPRYEADFKSYGKSLGSQRPIV
jgi:hypothetical protein